MKTTSSEQLKAFIVSLLFAGFLVLLLSNVVIAQEDLKSQIDPVIEDFMAATVKADGDAFGKVYTADAIVYPPGQPALHGPEKIAEVLCAVPHRVVLKTQEIEPAGDMIWETGSYTISEPDGVQLDSGNYLVLWKKTDDGWKRHRDIFNSDGKTEPLAPATE